MGEAMMVRHRGVLGVVVAGLLVMVSPAFGDDPPKAAATRVLIPFDFESTFDNGRYGAMVGDQIWTKVRKQGGFILPESMQDVRDWCERSKVHPNPETSLEEMKRIVVQEQAGDVAIWGKIERVPGTELDEYDVRVKVVDFSTDPPKVLHDATGRTKTVSEIPHVYIKAALDDLYGRAPGAEVATDAKPRKAIGPNLVKGDFEAGRGAPAGWDPLPRFVTWIKAEGDGAERRGKVIRFTLDEATAGTTGVLYYSEPFPVEEGATYRFSCQWRSTGSAVKVFIKCYDEFSSRYQDASGKALTSQRREVYRSQQNLTGPPNTWNVQSEEFTPKHVQFNPRWGRVMLYAYWPVGVVEWDDVVVEQVSPAPKGSTGERR
jgi:hypothetical protein